jgi:dihydroxy-acid dehydratase
MTQEKKLQGIDQNLTSYGDAGFSRYLRRAFLASSGYDEVDYSRPLIAIADTSSDYTTCHRGMGEIIEAIKRGVLEAGGWPLVFPTISLPEILISPTSMVYRNLLAMETEEMLRSHPMDAVVLTGGCDKTVPAQLMAAVSANVPAISVVTGPMLTSTWQGERLGACTDCRRFWMRYRGGELDDQEIDSVEKSLCTTGGTCMVMGTASTMACLTETLGLMLPGGATAPSATGDRLRNAAASGRQAVALAQNPITPQEILSEAAFKNAMIVLMALGGSTNAIIHLTAIAKRAGITLTLNDFQEAAEKVPLLVDCQPSGVGYMEDFHRAGGMPAMLRELEPLLDLSVKTVTGKSLGELIKSFAPASDSQTTIGTLTRPLSPGPSIVALSGSLAPDGAVIKVSATSGQFAHHQGPAVVFDSPEDAARRIDDPSLKITPDHVLVLRNAGPVAAGMPEAGSLPIPKYLVAKGVTDMVRVSDARMSGTAYGTVVLHCSPEAAVGGPLALVKNGDVIELNIKKRKVNLLVNAAELEKRHKQFEKPELPSRGWARLYAKNVLQAHLGADLGFLV